MLTPRRFPVDFGLEDMLEDFHAAVRHARAAANGGPVIAFGFSAGGFLVAAGAAHAHVATGTACPLRSTALASASLPPCGIAAAARAPETPCTDAGRAERSRDGPLSHAAVKTSGATDVSNTASHLTTGVAPRKTAGTEAAPPPPLRQPRLEYTRTSMSASRPPA